MSDWLKLTPNLYRNNFGSPVASARRRSGRLPSWWEFVEWLLQQEDPAALDPHYRPAHLQCGLCSSLLYTHILTYENFHHGAPAPPASLALNSLQNRNCSFRRSAL